ncbi:MAG: DUF1501 domain-containing protein, partial [Planctomycetaceae bacterium]
MNPLTLQDSLNRRIFLNSACGTTGTAALAALLQSSVAAAADRPELQGLPHHAPKARRIIYLFQSGAPSQMDLFDPKPAMTAHRGQNLPESVRQGQRLTTMTSGQGSFPVAPSIFHF